MPKPAAVTPTRNHTITAGCGGAGFGAGSTQAVKGPYRIGRNFLNGDALDLVQWNVVDDVFLGIIFFAKREVVLAEDRCARLPAQPLAADDLLLHLALLMHIMQPSRSDCSSLFTHAVLTLPRSKANRQALNPHSREGPSSLRPGADGLRTEQV